MMNNFGCHGFLGGGFGFMNGGMWFSGLIFLIIVVAIVYLLSRNNNNHKSTALELLDQEYAKGNVSDDDYRKRKENLTK